MFDPGLVLAGFAVGALVGLTGIGSGSLMAPFLILVLGTRPLVAVGTGLAYAAVTKVAGGAQHLAQGTVDRRLGLTLAAGSVPAALVGVLATGLLQSRFPAQADALVAHAVGLALLIVAGAVVAEPFIGAGWRARVRLRGRAGIVALGAVVGLLVGLTSLGSGSLLGAALVLLTGLPYRRVVGTDVAHGALLTTAAAVAHLAFGHVDVPLTLALLAGSVPGVVVGSRLAVRLPEHALRPAFGVVLALAGIRLI